MAMVRSVGVLTACAVLVACATTSVAPNATPHVNPTAIPAASPTVTPTVTSTPPVVEGPAAVQAARAVRSLLEQHTAAWDIEKSGDAIMALWADDVRFTDLLAGWREEPRATLERMVRQYVGRPGLGSSPHDYFVDTTGGLESYDVWGLGDATEANPVNEVDLYETQDGLLISMHTVYDVESLAHITRRPVTDLAAMETLIQGYADAWSSGEPSSVAELYAQTALRTATLWGESAEGREAISEAAARHFSLFPGAIWQVDTVFGDGPKSVMNGGILTLHLAEPDSCDLRAAVVLETNEARKITAERVYWDLDSLLRCVPELEDDAP
jgi:hypothetical protein